MSDLGMLGNVVKWKYKGSENILLFQFFPSVCFCCPFQPETETAADSDLATTEKMLYKIIIDKIKPNTNTV